MVGYGSFLPKRNVRTLEVLYRRNKTILRHSQHYSFLRPYRLEESAILILLHFASFLLLFLSQLQHIVCNQSVGFLLDSRFCEPFLD